MKSKPSIFASFCVFALVTIMSSCNFNKSYSFDIAAGFEGGTYYQIAKSLDSLMKISVNITGTKGSQENIQLLQNKKVDIALVQLDIFYNLLAADKDIEKNVKLLLPLYSEEVHLIAQKNIKSIKKLKGKKVCLGDTKSGTAGTAQIIIDVYKLTDKIKSSHCSIKSGLKKLASGKLDAMFLVSGAPVRRLKKLNKKLHLLSFKGRGYRFLTSGYFSYSKKTLSKKNYKWIKKKVKTLAVSSAIIVHKDVDEKKIKFLAQRIIRERKKLITFHPKWKFVKYKKMKKFHKKNKEFFHPAVSSIFNN